MFENEKFHALSKSLADGFFADNAVLALSKLREGIALSDNDENALLECLAFFAKHGNNESYSDCLILVHHKKLPDMVLNNLINFFTIFGLVKLHETEEIISSWF